MRVFVDMHDTTLDGDRAPVPSLQAICLRCGKVVAVYGRSSASKRRALCMMRDGCPRGEENFYEDSVEAPGPLKVGVYDPPTRTITIGSGKAASKDRPAMVKSTGPIVIGKRDTR